MGTAKPMGCESKPGHTRTPIGLANDYAYQRPTAGDVPRCFFAMPTLGLSMIVKNGGEDLRYCLQSAAGVVDEIVIADTGSTDDSIAIAREFGATTLSIPWPDNYAEARNLSLAQVTTDWVLVLDADEELPPDASTRLTNILRQATGNVGGFLLNFRNFVSTPFTSYDGQMAKINHDRSGRAAAAPAYVEHRATRLFLRHPEIFFSGSVHESVDLALAQSGRIKLAVTDFHIDHYGYFKPELWERKKLRYRELGYRKVQEQPDNHMAWRELGMVQYLFDEHAEVLRCMERDYALSAESLPLVYLAKVRYKLGDLAAALELLNRIPDEDALCFEKRHCQGDVFHDLGRLSEAQTAYEAALAMSHALSEYRVWRPVLESKLGYVEVRLGEIDRGLQKLLWAVVETPGVYDSHDRLMKALVMLNRFAEAADVADEMRKRFPSPKTALRSSALRSKARQTVAMATLEA